jgi:hypothetical protein
MVRLRFTLVAEGPTDRVLLYPLRSLLSGLGVAEPMDASFVDWRVLPDPPKTMEEKIQVALELYPCDLLFIHRDADRETREVRVRQIRQAMEYAGSCRPYVCVVPVRMMEAWFLFDEAAIRRGAENPEGRNPLDLPTFSKVERLPDPKAILNRALREASERGRRRLRGFKDGEAIYRVAEQISDFSPLRSLPAFQALEADLRSVLKNAGWV